jgi:microcompartment protein CcmK/EutM
MIPAKVIGRVVSNQTVPQFKGVKFLIVQPIDESLTPVGEPRVACDAIGANLGETVFMAQGREATFPLPDSFNPADLTIIAIIDDVTDDVNRGR